MLRGKSMCAAQGATPSQPAAPRTVSIACSRALQWRRRRLGLTERCKAQRPKDAQQPAVQLTDAELEYARQQATDYLRAAPPAMRARAGTRRRSPWRASWCVI